MTKDYCVRGIPSIFLIGPDGKILAQGLRDSRVEQAVDSALVAAGAKPSAVTPARGGGLIAYEGFSNDPSSQSGNVGWGSGFNYREPGSTKLTLAPELSQAPLPVPARTNTSENAQ